MTQAKLAHAKPLGDSAVICVSHGFQTNYERGFCNGLVACGADVTLISSDRTDYAGLSPGVRTLNLRGSQREDRSKLAKAVNLLRYHCSLMGYALLRRHTVVHVMGLIWPVFFCGVLQGLWFRLIGWRYVLTVHDLLPEVANRESYLRYCRWSYRLAHRLVVHTPRMKEGLVRDFGIPESRITVMEHGIEPQHGLPEAVHRRAREDGSVLLVAFGTVTPRKGTELLLQVLEGIEFPYRLVIAGTCVDQAFRELVQATLAVHPHRANIEWHDGFLEEADANSLLQSADVMVLPYRRIDQSGVLFQALRFGVPMVATRVGQFEHYVSEEVGELAPPDDAVGIREALLRWHARRHAISRARIREIGRSYEWNSTVRVLADAYGGGK